MKLDITVHCQEARWKALLRPYRKTVEGVCVSALAHTPLGKKQHRFEMAVVLADDQAVRALNRDYRGMDKATNVLSFPSGDFTLKGKGSCYLGDVVLALGTVEREAKAQGKTPRHHTIHLLVHGTLHLVGYDHQASPEARRMEELEVEILKKLRISNPYL